MSHLKFTNNLTVCVCCHFTFIFANQCIEQAESVIYEYWDTVFEQRVRVCVCKRESLWIKRDETEKIKIIIDFITPKAKIRIARSIGRLYRTNNKKYYVSQWETQFFVGSIIVSTIFKKKIEIGTVKSDAIARKMTYFFLFYFFSLSR